MSMLKLKSAIKYAIFGGAATLTALSLRNNDYQLNSIGIVRLSRAAWTVFNISLIYKNELYALKLNKDSDEYRRIKSICHEKSAQKLLDLCCTNKGVFIKVGQHIGSLDYLLPKEYVQTLKILHSHAPTSSIKDIKKVIKEELNVDPDDVFTDLDLEPLGTASLAQVHRGVLKDGTIVAVKVQHPYIQANAKVDLKTMEILVAVVSRIFPEFKFQWLVEETKKNIPRELDFQQEGHNAEKVAEIFNNYKWLRIPKIRWNLTTPRILTMDFEEGGQVNDLEYIKINKIDPFEISDKLGQLYAHMIFINGFVHSDPHPGNILVRKAQDGGCEIILLDHGLYADLKDEFRVAYSNLWLSILNKDRKLMRDYCKDLGIEGNLYGLLTCMITGRTWDNIMKGVVQNKQTKADKKVLQSAFTSILPQISEVLDQVNRQMLLILKTNDLMRGIEHTLSTEARMGSYKVMSECCVKSIYNEKICNSASKVTKFKLKATQYWTLLKIKVYFSYLLIKDLTRQMIEYI